MGRLSSLFDTKRNEENRRLINGYFEEKAKRELLPKTEYRTNTEQVNTAPTSYSPVKVEMENPAPSNDVNLYTKYKAREGYITPDVKPVDQINTYNNLMGRDGYVTQTTSNQNNNQIKPSYEEKLGIPKEEIQKRVKEYMAKQQRESYGQDFYENTKEYQAYNKLSQLPIIGNYAPMLALGEYALSVPISSAEGAANLVKQVISKDKLDESNFTFAKKSNALREGGLRALRNNLGMKYDDVVDSGEKTANFIGGVIADSASSSANALAFGRGSLAVAGLNAANQDMLESSRNENLNKNQLLASGVAHGVTEAAWEFLPTMRFLELSKNGLGTSAKEITKNVVKQMGQEGIEEFGTDITNDITDALIKGKESDVVKEYLARRENGESDVSAKLHTGASRIENAGMSFLAGALSGGMSAGMAGVSHTFTNGKQYSDINNFKEIAESADTSTEEGKAIHEVASRLAEKEAKGQRITDFDRGYLSNAVENAAIEDYNRQQEELKSKDNLQESKDNHQKEAEAEKSGSVPYALFSNTEAGQQAKLESAIHENLSKSNRESVDYENPLKEFSKNYDKEGQKAFIDNYDGSVPLTEYIKASTHAYNLGRYNYNLNGEDSLEKTASMALLSKEQRESLFKAGVKDYENAISKWNVNYKERIEKRTGGLMDSVPHAPENLKKVLGALGKKTGILFRVVDSKYQDGNTSNGSYEMGRGIITIDLQSDNVLGTVSHEMTHWIKEYASEGEDQGMYGWFKGLALNSILKSKNTDLDSLIETYKQAYGNLSNEEITDEIVADSTMHFLNDEEFINKLVNGTEEQKSLGMKVVQWLNDIIESFKDLISHSGERLASRALREDLSRYEKTRDAWLVAMSMAKENMARNEAVTEKSDSGELSQVQLQKIIDEKNRYTLKERLENILDIKESKNDEGMYVTSHVYLRETPSILRQELGYRNLPMLMTSNHVYTSIKTEQEAENENNYRENTNYHGLGIELATKAIEKMDSPDYIIKSSNDADDLGIVLFCKLFDKKSKQIMVAIKPEETASVNGPFLDTNIVLSTYGRKNYLNYIKKAIEENRMLYSSYLEKNGGNLNPKVQYNDIQESPDLTEEEQTKLKEIQDSLNLTSVKNSLVQYNEAVNKRLTDRENNLLNQLDISEDYYNSLVEENENLKEENSYLSDVLNAETRFEPSRSDVNRIASGLLSQYNSQFSKAKLADQLNGFYKYLNEARDIDGGEVRSVSRAIAREVIENATYKEDSEVQDYKKVKEFFSGRPIYITEGELHDLGYEKFGDLRKQYFGKVDFRKATVDNRGNADDVYKSFTEAFPYLVTGDKSYTDELNNLIEAYEMATPKVYEAFPGEEHDHAVDRLSDEIYDAFLSVGDERLYQKYKDGYKKIKKKARAEVQAEYQKKYNKALDKIKQLRKDYENSLISHEEFIDAESRLLSRGGAEYQARLEMHRAYRQKQEEQRHRQLYKKEIVRDSKALMKMAVSPTDNLHVPKVLLKDLVPVLSAVDFSSYDAFYEKKPKIEMTAKEFERDLKTLKDRIQEAENNGDIFTEDNGKGVYFPIDPNLKESLTEIEEAVSGIDGNMNRLSTDDLHTLRDSLQGFKHLVESQNKYVSQKSNERISDVSNAVIGDLRKEKNATEYAGIVGGVKNGLKFNMLDPLSYFHTMGEGGDKIYKMLRNARDKKTLAFASIMDKYHEEMEKLGITPEYTKNLSKEKIKFTATNLDNMQEQSVKMTKANLMSMYMYTIRDQGRMHLFGEIMNDETGEREEGNFKLGGFKIKGKPKGIFQKIDSDGNTYKLSSKDMDLVIKEHLGEKDIALAKLIGSILSNETAMVGNEASNAVYGYDKFTEKNYFPIKVDGDSLTMKNADLEKMMSTLKNKGMTKSLQKEAYNPIIIDDIFDVMVNHIDEMTTYGAYFPAITDMQKFYNMSNENGDSVHRQISRVMGKGGTDYYMNLLRDLNGSRGEDTPIGKIAYGLAGGYKGALIGNNLRVAAQQPMSYMRAMAAIEIKYLMQGLTLPLSEANAEWEICQKYAPIARWKAMGGSYDINLGRSTRSLMTGETNWRDNMNAVSFYLLEKGDEGAWKRLWYASEKKVEDTTNFKKGTEEYYKAAAEIFNDIIDKTQVVDTVLNRTDAMKDKSAMAKVATSFMSEPSKTYNMMYRLIYDVKRGKATAGEVGTVVSSIVISSAMVSAAASVISAMRDRDKEKKFGERWLDHFINDYFQNINPVNWVIIAKDVMEIVSSRLNGKRYYSNNLTIKPLMDFLDGITEVQNLISGNPRRGWGGTLYKMTNAANLAGIPLYNMLRDIGAVYDTVIFDSPLKNVQAQYERDKAMINIHHRRTKNQTVEDEDGKEHTEKVYQGYDNIQRFLGRALKAYMLGDQKTGDYIIEDIKKHLGDEAVNKAMQRTLSQNETVQEMAKKKLDGEAIEEEQEELRSLGYSDAMIDKALESAVKKLKPIENQDLAEKLFENTEDSEDSLKEFVEYQKSLGKNDDKIRSSIKTAVTTKYKPQYQEAIGHPEESDEILKKVLRIKYNGKQLYTESDLKKWAK